MKPIRPQRKDRPTRIVTADIPLDQIRGHRCAWRGCREAFPILQDMPPGWRWLLLWPDTGPETPTFNGILAVADRDAVLCPEHAAALHNEVLEDIGQRLKTTKGSA